MEKVFIEECWSGSIYLKNHMDIVSDYDNYTEEFLLRKIRKLVSEEGIVKKIVFQRKVCSNTIGILWNSKDYEQLKNNVINLSM